MMRALLLLLLPACSLVTHFDRETAVEQTSTLCSDGIDNDSDGLFDCQDWKCAAQPACCTIPVIVIADDFEHDACSKLTCGSGSCQASTERWSTWGSPLPEVCEGAFVSGKLEQCYDVGILSVTAVTLRPGLVMTAGFTGQPEIQGRVRVGVTFQNQIIGSPDPCAPTQPADLALAIAMVSTTDGYRFVAQFGGIDVGASPTLSDGARHELVLRVLDDRRVRYELDGAEFVTSAANQTVPVLDQSVHVALMGRGMTARIADLEVTVGARCEDSAAWIPAPRFLDLPASGAPAAWDGFAVFGPSIIDGDPQTLYYGGCGEASGTCDPVIAGYGRATSDSSGQFVRDRTCPSIASPGLVCPGGLGSPFSDIYNDVFDLDAANGPDGVVGVLSQPGGTKIALVKDLGAGFQVANPPIETGPPGSWDAAEVCCASIVIGDNGLPRIWYSGRAEPGGPSRIGEAQWTPLGVIKNEKNPVLAEGRPGGIDDHGVHDPDVIWDAERKLYRMWYVADGPLGLTSIAYAVSPDGVHWHEAPDNPVIGAEAIGLRTIGAPTVSSRGGDLTMWIEGISPDRASSQIYRLVNSGIAPGE